jgi:hypothetical protein
LDANLKNVLTPSSDSRRKNFVQIFSISSVLRSRIDFATFCEAVIFDLSILIEGKILDQKEPKISEPRGFPEAIQRKLSLKVSIASAGFAKRGEVDKF